MQTKLTLRLDEKLIRRAKAHAKRTGQSVSKIVADYFAMLGKGAEEDDRKLTPTVRSLKVVLRGAEVDVEDYRRHFREKHL